MNEPLFRVDTNPTAWRAAAPLGTPRRDWRTIPLTIGKGLVVAVVAWALLYVVMGL